MCVCYVYTYYTLYTCLNFNRIESIWWGLYKVAEMGEQPGGPGPPAIVLLPDTHTEE